MDKSLQRGTSFYKESKRVSRNIGTFLKPFPRKPLYWSVHYYDYQLRMGNWRCFQWLLVGLWMSLPAKYTKLQTTILNITRKDANGNTVIKSQKLCHQSSVTHFSTDNSTMSYKENFTQNNIWKNAWNFQNFCNHIDVLFDFSGTRFKSFQKQCCPPYWQKLYKYWKNLAF